MDYVRRALRKLELDESKVRQTQVFYFFSLNLSQCHNSAVFSQLYYTDISPTVKLILRFASHVQVFIFVSLILLRQLPDSVIQSYHDLYISRMNEMVAFNMVSSVLGLLV